ncbi:MAG: endonuclease [Salinivirgaceae bacterium]|nr:endonuclease [Salinivirgaceae bacterium]
MKYLLPIIRKQLVAIFFVALSQVIFAQSKDIPAGYYDDASGLSGYSLKTALHNIIKSGHSDQGYDALYSAYAIGDNDPDDNYVWDMYSENPEGADPYNFTHFSDKCGNYSNEGDCYNREHLFPQGIFNEASPMKSDYHHVVPSDGKVNGMRGSYPFGETDSPSWTSQNGSKRGSCSYSGYSGIVFEPIDEYKGDIARCMLYFATRYEDKVSSWSHDMINGTSEQVYADWFIEMLIEWHSNDPVSTKDIMRNEAGYDHQGNRNPFIDHPEYVNSIWGGNAATIFTNIVTSPAEPTYSDVVAVSATITDAEGINTVSLSWGTTSGSLSNTIAMNNSTGDTYETSTNIPAQADGTTVYYKIVVLDNTSVTSSSSIRSYHIGEIPVELTLLDEDFETTEDDIVVELTDWLNINQIGFVQWEGRIFGSNKYAQASSYQSAEENEIWLITPEVDLDQSKGEVFSFDVNVAYWTHVGFSVLISQNFDGANVGTATWEDITSNFTIPTTPTSGYGTMGAAGAMSLDSYTGSIYIAFKYNGDDSGSTGEVTTYQVDNVLIEGIEDLGDNTAPILTYSPENGATDVAYNTTITINSTEALYTNSGTDIDENYIKSVVAFKVSDDQGADVEYAATINSEKKTITLTPNAELLSETTYYVAVADKAFEDTAANETLASSASFSTKVADVTAPILSISPANNSTNVAFDATVTISSTEALLTNTGAVVDETYIKSVVAFKVSDDQGADVEYAATINAEKKTITLTPNTELLSETTYYVAVADRAFEDTSANETTAENTLFTTMVAPDVTAPILTFLPQNGASDVSLDATITINSTEALLTNTGAVLDEIYIKSVLTFKESNDQGAAVSYSAVINADKKIITITPDDELTVESVYYIAIADRAFEDTAANETAAENIWFSTQPLFDITAPVLSLTPENGATNIDLDTMVTISSNEALLTNTGAAINEDYIKSVITFKISDDQGADVDYSVTISTGNDSITITPSSDLLAETIYYVAIADNAFEDTAANETTTASISFTTREAYDLYAPILGFTPEDGATNVSLATSVVIESNESLFYGNGENLTITNLASNFKFTKDSISGEAIDFSVILNEGKTKITLTSYVYLDAYQQYFITLIDNVFEDVDGNETDSIKFSFTTISIGVEIIEQPQNVVGCFGDDMLFVVKASGSGEISYEWQFNDTEIAFANNDTLLIENAQESNVGSYKCIVSNNLGEETSNTATLSFYDLVYAGNDSSIQTVDTITEINLYNLLENYSENGSWLDFNSSGAFSNGIFNPSVAGVGIFNFKYSVEGDCNADEAFITINVEKANSIKWDLSNEIEIFPNPTSGLFYMNLPENNSKVQINIFSSEGRLVFTKNCDLNTQNTFDFSEFSKGIYFLKIQSDSWQAIKRISIQ